MVVPAVTGGPEVGSGDRRPSAWQPVPGDRSVPERAMAAALQGGQGRRSRIATLIQPGGRPAGTLFSAAQLQCG
jgi:hypothetical protein